MQKYNLFVLLSCKNTKFLDFAFEDFDVQLAQYFYYALENVKNNTAIIQQCGNDLINGIFRRMVA